MPQLHEDSVRFIRQRLLALEEGRDKDAKTIADYLASEFGLEVGRDLVDVKVDDVRPDTLARWRSYYGLPDVYVKDHEPALVSKLRVVTVLKTHNNEPIFRIPADRENRGPGVYETPLHLVNEVASQDPALAGSVDDNPWDNPFEHLRPRAQDGRTGRAKDLPEAVAKAIRVWTPTTLSEG